MGKKWRWSPPRLSVEGLGEGVLVSRATAWRRRVGVFEEGGLFGPGCSFGPVDLLGRWLVSAGPAVTLRLVFKVGGAQRSVAWVGLAADGGTPRDARRRLFSPATDLGEALDSWGLFEELPGGGPRYPRAGRRVLLGPVLPCVEVDEDSCDRGAALQGALWALSHRPTPISLCVDVRGGNRDPALFGELDRLDARARFQADSAGREFVSWLDGSAQRAASVVGKVEELTEAALVGEVDIRLHGSPPGALLREQLLQSLGWDLNAQPTLADEALEPPLFGSSVPLSALLRWLAVGMTARPRRIRTAERRPFSSERVLF